MDAAAREMGAAFAVVDLPGLCRSGVDPASEEFRAVVEQTRVTPANYPFWAEAKKLTSRLFAEAARRTGAPVIRVSSRFARFTGPGRLELFTDEVHVNRRGAAEVAEAVRQALSAPSS